MMFEGQTCGTVSSFVETPRKDCVFMVMMMRARERRSSFQRLISGRVNREIGDVWGEN